MSDEQANGKSNEAESASEDEVAEDGTAEPRAVRDAGSLRLTGRRRGKRLVAPEQAGGTTQLTAEQRLLILDTWNRSGLPAKDFAPLVGVSKHTLYGWKARFEESGPAGLMDRPRNQGGSKMPELTKRTILLLKAGDPTLGCQRISDMLARGPALGASPSAVARVLKEAGYELEEVATRPHRDHVRRFEREKPNQLWQTDLFTFVLKRQNRRVYLVGFMDDHSRFIVGFGLHASQSTALVLEALRSSITNHGVPEEILTDNGSQYVTWRGESAFNKELVSKGIRHIVAKPRRPQTLGKIERFWGTLWRECAESAVCRDLDDARQRLSHFVDHYNFHRPHQGLGGAVPADRYYSSAPQVLDAQKRRIADNALELARHGTPRQPLYITGQAGGRGFTVHSEGDRVFLTREGEPRQEVDLTPPAEPPPGTSPLDDALAEVRAQMARRYNVEPTK